MSRPALIAAAFALATFTVLPQVALSQTVVDGSSKALTEKEWRVVKAAFFRAMNDPVSAQLAQVEKRDRGTKVCGLVNAKNQYGGYVGFTRFVVNLEADEIFVSTAKNLDASSPEKELLAAHLAAKRYVEYCSPE